MTINANPYPVLYFVIGIFVIQQINRRSFNIYEEMDNADFSNKAQGIISFMLIITWPVWLLIAIHGYIVSRFLNNPPEAENG